MTNPKPNPNTPPKTVSSMADLAAHCGVNISTVKGWKKSHGFPIEPNGEYSPFRVGQWHAMKMVSPSNPKVNEETGDDDELMNLKVSSPMLERLREEKWKLAKMDRIEREKGLIKRDRVRAFILRIASLLRAAIDRIQRQIGLESFQIIMDVIDDIETETEREFRDLDDDEEEGDPFSD